MKATNHPSDKMTIKNNNGDLLLEIDAEGVQEIKFKDGSKYTGAEIDAAVTKAGDATKVEANPTLAGTEAALAGLQVGDTKYKVDGGVLNVLFGMGENETIICNHTFTEIYNALENKQPVIFAEEVKAGAGSGLISTSVEYSSSEIIASFYSFSFGSGDATLVITKYIIASDNTITGDYADRSVSTL